MIKISEKLIAQLTQAGNSKILAANYDKIFKLCFVNLSEDSLSENGLKNLNKIINDEEGLSLVYNSIFLITIEALHNNLDHKDIKSFLGEFISDSNIINDYSEKYK
jgi:hypothetical protein